MAPLLLLNAVGLTPRLLPFAPRLKALAGAGWMRPLCEVMPAVTCTAQATLLTGQLPPQHGIVANGWFWRNEVRYADYSEDVRIESGISPAFQLNFDPTVATATTGVVYKFDFHH